MSQKFNPEMLRLARESRGFNQIELCEKLKIAQGTISKMENELIVPSDSLLEDIAHALRYPSGFFRLNLRSSTINIAYYRRKMDVPKTTISKAQSRMNIIKMQIEKLLEGVDIPDTSLYNWNVTEYGPPERAAKHIRAQWNVPRGKIKDPIGLLEDHGYIIIPFDFETERIDGLSMFTSTFQPLIFVNRNMPLDRQLLTIYHEFGHLVLHLKNRIDLDRDIESEAFDFASEFLVPTSDFEGSFSYLDLNTLATLKMYWNLSMAALLKKASSTELISKNQAKYLWAQLSKLGYRKREPEILDIDIPKPTLLKEIVEVFCKSNKYSLQMLSDALCVHMDDLIENMSLVEEQQLKVISLQSFRKNQSKSFI